MCMAMQSYFNLSNCQYTQLVETFPLDMSNLTCGGKCKRGSRVLGDEHVGVFLTSRWAC